MKITKKITEIDRNLMKVELYSKLQGVFNAALYEFQSKYGILSGDTSFESDIDSKFEEISELGLDVLEEQLGFSSDDKFSVKEIMENVLVKKFENRTYKSYLCLNDSICYDDFVKPLEENEICINNEGKFELRDSSDSFFINYYNIGKINLSAFADKSIMIYNVPDGAEIEISEEEVPKIMGIYGADINVLTLKSPSMIPLHSCDISELKLVGCDLTYGKNDLFLHDTTVRKFM